MISAIQGRADTFTNTETGEKLTGYVMHEKQGSETFVQTEEKGRVKLNLSRWDMKYNHQGRKNQVTVIQIDTPIMYKFVTDSVNEAIKEASDEGPLFVLLEIDTPGGRTDLAKSMSTTITDSSNCPVYAYVVGSKNSGAISAGAFVALSCDKIYMTRNSVIGAATPWLGAEDGPTDLRTAYGDEVGEKFLSAWMAIFSSVAEQNGKSGLLARAMVDKDIEVIEVKEDGKRFFINPINKRNGQSLVKVWSQKDSLLTLTGEQAAECRIADGLADSREELLKMLDAEDAETVIDDRPQLANREIERAKKRLGKINKAIDYQYEQLNQSRHRAKSLRLLRKIRSSLRAAGILAKKYPDLGLDISSIEEELNKVEAIYKEHTR